MAAEICQTLNLAYIRLNGVEPGAPDICLTAPSCVKNIVGDGTCFYRSIALIITGSQSQHLAVRQAIVDHMKAIGDDLTGDSNTGIDDYIARNSVHCSGTWATELEMYALAHLLHIYIYYYEVSCKLWTRMDPGTLDRTFSRSPSTILLITLRWSFLSHSVNAAFLMALKQQLCPQNNHCPS